MIIQVIGALFATLSFAIITGVPKKFLILCSSTGAAGWFTYLLSNSIIENEVSSMFIAALMVSLLSHIYARVRRAPVTIFLIPGILPLVPGVGMVRAVYYNIIGDAFYSNHYLSLTLQTAGVIAIAILIMDTCFRIYRIHPKK